ncbi:hypothetical protein BDR03DRAFT_962369 [Suillus americanus]|nr:hypothetical protein BDR03DRAFT_962369 [Suillus americanus]
MNRIVMVARSNSSIWLAGRHLVFHWWMRRNYGEARRSTRCVEGKAHSVGRFSPFTQMLRRGLNNRIIYVLRRHSSTPPHICMNPIVYLLI